MKVVFCASANIAKLFLRFLIHWAVFKCPTFLAFGSKCISEECPKQYDVEDVLCSLLKKCDKHSKHTDCHSQFLFFLFLLVLFTETLWDELY